jgi:lysophospholipase L1-like esterase
MGGSSTFGVPMRFSGKTYSAILQKLLDTRPASEQYEVLNAGIAGFGIWQIVEALERTVLADKPDIVMICPWFNDSSWIPGWYGFPDISDKEAYEAVKKLRAIESSSWYQFLRSSQAYALLRFAVQRLTRKETAQKESSPRQERKRRSSPAEFRAGVEYFLALAEKHNFLPIFVTEALNRTRPWDDLKDQHPYYKVLTELGQHHGVPIVDTLTPLAQHSDEWLFYDFIHPNEHGHGIIAQAIFESFFDVRWHTERSRSWFWRRRIGLSGLS